MNLLLSIAALGSFVVISDASDSNKCFLLDGTSSKKPFPSLTQCYKNNQDACCVSAHDSTIQGDYSGHLSETCLREYQDLEHYFCLGCNPEMDKYVQWYNKTCTNGKCNYKLYDKKYNTQDSAKLADHKHGKYGMVKICDAFRDKLLYASDSSKSLIDKYDNCGLILGGSGQLPSSYFVDANGDKDVYKFFDEIRPPYFKADKFDLSHGGDKDSGRAMDGGFNLNPWDDASNPVCFQAASTASVSVLVLMVSLFWSKYLL